MKNAASLLAAALLGVSAVQADETTTQVVYPYMAPVTYAPAAIDPETVKAYMEYQQKAYEYFTRAYQHYLAYQQQAAANAPDYLKITAIPPIPSLHQHFPQNTFAMAPQPVPFAPNLDQTFSQREEQLNAELETAQARLTERQESLQESLGRAK